jgi:hypothetical protein
MNSLCVIAFPYSLTLSIVPPDATQNKNTTPTREPAPHRGRTPQCQEAYEIANSYFFPRRRKQLTTS